MQCCKSVVNSEPLLYVLNTILYYTEDRKIICGRDQAMSLQREFQPLLERIDIQSTTPQVGGRVSSLSRPVRITFYVVGISCFVSLFLLIIGLLCFLFIR